jgi:hypothetical protein
MTKIYTAHEDISGNGLFNIPVNKNLLTKPLFLKDFNFQTFLYGFFEVSISNVGSIYT